MRVRNFITDKFVRYRIWSDFGQAQSLSLAHNVFRGRGIGLWRSRRGHSEQLLIAGDQVAVFIEVTDDQIGSFTQWRD